MRQLWRFCILFGSNFAAMRKYGDTTITQFDSFPPNLRVNIYGKSAKYSAFPKVATFFFQKTPGFQKMWRRLQVTVLT